MKTIHLRHPEPLNFDLHRLGLECTVALPTRGQMRRAIELDPEGNESREETHADADARRALQLAILTEGSNLPLDRLTAEEEVQILHAIVAAHHGFDPGQAVALQQTLKKKAHVVALLGAWNALTATASTSPPS